MVKNIVGPMWDAKQDGYQSFKILEIDFWHMRSTILSVVLWPGPHRYSSGMLHLHQVPDRDKALGPRAGAHYGAALMSVGAIVSW